METRLTPNAYAHVDSEGHVVVETVAPTKLGAMVNAIFVGSFGNVVPMNSDLPEHIEQQYLNITGGDGSIKAVACLVVEDAETS